MDDDGNGELDIDEFAALMSKNKTIKETVQREAESKWGVGQRAFGLSTITFHRRQSFKEKITEIGRRAMRPVLCR